LLYVAAVRKFLVAGLTNGKVLATDSLSLLYPSRDAKFTRAFDEILPSKGVMVARRHRGPGGVTP